MADEWMSPNEAAQLLGVSRATVLRSLSDPDRRLKEWGEPGTGWRHKPLSSRGDYQLRRSAVEAKATGA
ncbi:hypothetical protein ACGFI9_37150 [Micromonospora sp. NPDC048930]|uniref:hypothetical protein n=1 Tax=Micromonospora sp. NPDC048930 TaxID=3364261 RepID=UPI003713E24C